MKPKSSIRLFAASASLVGLAACGGGGGGASTGGTMVTGGGTTTTPAPTLLIQAAAPASLGGNASLQEKTPTQFVGWNGTPGGNRSAPPPVGTVFPLLQSTMTFMTGHTLNTTAGPADLVNSQGATATYTGTVNISGVQVQNYDVKIPGLGIDVTVPLFHQNIPGTSNGWSVQTNAQFLNYMMAGDWSIGPTNVANVTQYEGDFSTGFQTPASAVPTTGQGTYATSITSPPGAITVPTVGGTLLINYFGSTVTGTISGNATVSVDFASGAVNGSMTQMRYSVIAGPAGTWNDVSLTGSLAGANVSGTTAATNAGTGDGAFDTSSTGVFNGALYGPNGQELGVIWTLHDPTGLGKTATGFIAAEKTN